MVAGLFIWGFIQSFVVGLLIPLVKRARNNFLLSIIFFVIALNILFQYLLRYQGLKIEIPVFLIAPDILDLILPALVLIYINNIMGKLYDRKMFYYFVPPVFWSLVLIGFVVLSEKFNNSMYIGSVFHRISLSFIFLWKLFVFYKALTLFRFKDESLKQKQAALILWPRVLVIFLGLLTFIAFSNLMYWVVVGPEKIHDTVAPNTVASIGQQVLELNYVVFTCSIIFITIYFSFKHPKILSGLPIIKSLEDNKFPEGAKYEKELNALIHSKKIHLDTELNEKKLAEALGVHSYILSRLLNDYIGKSFSEYINEKRIEEAKAILQNDKNKDLTIFAVAVDSGFRSESVFYVNFKKITGLTPTQFKKQLKQKQSAKKPA
ncbi:helix-turn-helix domain-containing protein [Tamlana sp. I1]|uniref:helix-turn-helix domain-containing protein n=1 Tax=Tamlana sp. I1 TaxID=2762061 RepID=UPI00188E5B78|nr:helix-turn-helix domain-containing protein [Tamlana sp. I1]